MPQVYINGINVALRKSTYQTSSPYGAGYTSDVGVDGSKSTLIHTGLYTSEWLPYVCMLLVGVAVGCTDAMGAVQWRWRQWHWRRWRWQ